MLTVSSSSLSNKRVVGRLIATTAVWEAAFARGPHFLPEAGRRVFIY